MNTTKDIIKINYYLGGWNPQGWEGTVEEAINIALAEIYEHAGATSPAYIFTRKVFDYFNGIK